MAIEEGRKGFTLVEVLATLSIMSVFIALVISTVMGSLMVSGNIEESTRCIILANKKMEEIKSRILGISTESGYTFGWDRDYTQTGAFALPDSDYRYLISDPDYPVSGKYIRDIRLIVWHDKDGDGSYDVGEKSVTWDTRIARRN